MKSLPNLVSECQTVVVDRHHDGRGFFQEMYNEAEYRMLPFDGLDYSQAPVWQQINWSHSGFNVLRGIHLAPFEKLVTCVHGRIFDVVVDLRRDSGTYLKWFGAILDADKPTQMFVPAHCGHGFLSMTEGASVVYFQASMYDPSKERSIRWDDADINIMWPCTDPVVSDRDRSAKYWREVKCDPAPTR